MAISEKLHQQHTVGPDVALDAESAVDDGLGGCPPNGEPTSLLRAVLVVLDRPGKAKVADLRFVLLAYEYVPRGEVSVYQLLALEVFHAGCHLRGYVDQILELHVLAITCPQEVQQAAVAHVLLHDVNRLLLGADRVQRDQVSVPELLHDGRLLEERLRRHGPRSQRLHSHFDFVPPLAVVHLAEIPVAQLPYQLDLVPVDLPFVPQLGPEVPHVRLRLRARLREHVAETQRVLCNVFNSIQ